MRVMNNDLSYFQRVLLYHCIHYASLFDATCAKFLSNCIILFIMLSCYEIVFCLALNIVVYFLQMDSSSSQNNGAGKEHEVQYEDAVY